MNHHQQTLAPFLDQWKRHSNIPPVLLLTGPSGIGKRAVAHWLAGYFLGHPGVADYRITELNASDTGSFTIDQFRKLKEGMGFGTSSELSKLVIIPDAERMTVQASNSILKLLEEPPQGWIFILTSNNASLLLPTITSRCQNIKLRPFSDHEIAQLLTVINQGPSEKIRVCAALAQGSVDRGVLFLNDEIWEKRQMVLRFLKNPGTFKEVLDWASSSFENDSGSEEDPAEILVDILEQVLADQSIKTLKNGSKPKEFWISFSEKLFQTRQKLRTPMNRKILVQDLLLPWLEVS